jgi:hypothetical protein
MIRIDPLTYEGRFDSDFYADDSYKQIRKKVEDYIRAEGFLDKPDTYFLNLFGHYWQIEIS